MTANHCSVLFLAMFTLAAASTLQPQDAVLAHSGRHLASLGW
jgi:hypothetical protein